MKIESFSIHTSELRKPGFGITPEGFNSVDMTLIMNKLILSMIDSKMLLVSNINKPVVASTAVRMNNCFQVYTASNNCLQRDFSTVRDNFSKTTTIAFEGAEYNCFSESSTPPFAFDAPSAKEAFINFSRKWRLSLIELRNSFSDTCEIPVNSIPVKSGNFSNLRSIQID